MPPPLLPMQPPLSSPYSDNESSFKNTIGASDAPAMNTTTGVVADLTGSNSNSFVEPLLEKDEVHSVGLFY